MTEKHDISRNKLIIIVGAGEHYPYPYKGDIIFHLNSSERKDFRNYLSTEIENAEKQLEEQAEYEKDWREWGRLFLGNNQGMASIVIEKLGKLIKKFLVKDVVLSADDFRILSLQISHSLYNKDSVSLSILSIVASGMRAYFNLEKANEGDVNDWISNGVRKIDSEAKIVGDSIMREYGPK